MWELTAPKAGFEIGKKLIEEAQEGEESLEHAGDLYRRIRQKLPRRQVVPAPRLSITPARFAVMLSHHVPSLTIVYSATHYEKIDIEPLAAFAYFQIGAVRINGLATAHLDVIKPADRIEVVIEHTLTTGEIVAMHNYPKADQYRAVTTLTLLGSRPGRFGQQNVFAYQTRPADVMGTMSGKVDSGVMSTAEAERMRKMLQQYDACVAQGREGAGRE